MDFATIATIAISVILTFKPIITKFLEKGLAAGATDYLIKPYFADLPVAIGQHIERTKKLAKQSAIINA